VNADRRHRVLVVDDEADIRAILSEYLGGLGYEILLAETAVGALGMVRTHRPDVVLLDLAMPGAVRGENVIPAIAAEAPVIVVTALNDLELARSTLRSGAFDFVMKPFDLRRVGELVEAAIAHGRRA
jgi:DNA-binding NtrC family response regulator